MKKTLAAILTGIAIAASAQQPILASSQSDAASPRSLESQFDALLRKENLREWMRAMTAHPHHLGSPGGKKNAEMMAELFRSWGYDTRIETFHVLMPTPKTRRLEMLAPRPASLRLAEPALPSDSTSGLAGQLPVYNAYSRDGDVTGELVYVNYGIPKDYEELARRGIDVRGKIVIARYGGSWRGIKPKVAAEHGALGCIIYSDPRDDGYFQGDVYPNGAWRNESGAQRGSVADMPLGSGDPLTPGRPSTKDAKRLTVSEAPTITKIPVTPISYGDALPLLRALGGPVAPEEWRGALPMTYHLGPGPTKIRMKLEFNWDIVPLYNVTARLQGSVRPDEWVIRGNHHDAWVFGADDPVSGLVALMEEARVLGELAKRGWRPARTLIYAAWDGEEQGLLGSVEWAEMHRDELREKGVAYVNSDSNGRGFLYVGGSHTLEKFINGVARDVVDPQTGVTVSDRMRAYRAATSRGDERRDALDRDDLRIAALGSGSDFTPFLQHLGMAVLNIGFGGEDGGGSYHSAYDSFDHYRRFGDPDFEYGIALAKVGGRTMLRLANAEVLPFEFINFSDTLNRYVYEVQKLADEMREETEAHNMLVERRAFTLAADPRQRFVAPKRKEPVPYLDFSPLQNAARRIDKSAAAHARARAAAGELAPETQRELDRLLYTSERALTSEAGLPKRPWYKHQIYAPGMYTGYGVKTLPAVREAIELRDWKTANEQIATVAKTLEKFADQIDRATALLAK